MSSDDNEPHSPLTPTPQPRSQLIKAPSVTFNHQGVIGDQDKPREWRELCRSDDTMIDGIYPYSIQKDGYELEVILARVNGELHALHDQCPHRRVPLSGSVYIEDDVIYCGYHGWGFHLSSGAHTVPTGISIPRYDIKESEGKVFISID